MTEKEILKGNKLIAEFMGGKYNSQLRFNISQDEIWLPIHGICNYARDKGKKLKYFSSWDWLMPVVEKIESLPDINQAGICVLIEHSYCRIYLDNWGKYTDVAQYVTKKDKLGAVYQAVVKFIKWYNENKQK